MEEAEGRPALAEAPSVQKEPRVGEIHSWSRITSHRLMKPSESTGDSGLSFPLGISDTPKCSGCHYTELLVCIPSEAVPIFKYLYISKSQTEGLNASIPVHSTVNCVLSIATRGGRAAPTDGGGGWGAPPPSRQAGTTGISNSFRPPPHISCME